MSWHYNNKIYYINDNADFAFGDIIERQRRQHLARANIALAKGECKSTTQTTWINNNSADQRRPR